MRNLDPFRIHDDPDRQPKSEPSWLRQIAEAARRFAWWAAAKVPNLVAHCSPNTQMKCTAIGVYIVVVLPILAFVAMFQFLRPLQLGIWGFVGAIAWAVFVPLLDRLVLLYQTGAKGAAKWIKAGIRFAGAGVTGLLVTEAIITLLFSFTIDRAIRARIDTQVAQTEARARVESTTRKEELLQDNASLQKRLDDFKAIRDEANRLRNAEADGQLGHAPGEAQHYNRRKGDWERASAEFEAERLIVEPKIAQNDIEIAQLEDNVKKRAQLAQEAEENSRDLLSKHQALFSIIFSSPSAAGLYGLMFLALLLLETAPLLQKVISNEDEYDRMVSEQETQLTESNKLSDQMSRDAIRLERTAWERAYKVIRDGRNLPVSEARVQHKLHAAVIASLLRRLFGFAPVDGLDQVIAIRFTVLNHPGVELTVQLPKPAADATTLGDLTDEVEGIAERLPHKGDGPQEFLEARTSLGREIFVHEPLAPQLESDKRVVLIYGDYRFGFRAAVVSA
ncbi:MAG: DUF4407 domain-containing protein [Pyrinomonadaceae bacterium]